MTNLKYIVLSVFASWFGVESQNVIVSRILRHVSHSLGGGGGAQGGDDDEKVSPEGFLLFKTLILMLLQVNIHGWE